MSEIQHGHAEDREGPPLREHSFDGIQEFDNKLPNWWLWTFFGSIIFAWFYWVHYHVLGTGPDQQTEFAVAMKENEARMEEAAKSRLDLTDEGLLAMSRDPEVVAEGRKIFVTNCTACHTETGAGSKDPPSIGPNLTDGYWIHGGKPTQIYRTVTEGVPLKGMTPWGPVLGATRVATVTAYVLTIKGTNLPGKDPEGEKESGD